MQIAATTPDVMITAEDMLMRPGKLDELLATMPEGVGRDAMKTWTSDLLALPGAQFVSYRSAEPDSLKVQFSDAGHQRLADSILRDTIGGAKLLVAVDERPDVPFPADDAPRKQPFWESVSNMRRAVSGMRGVHDFMADSTAQALYFLTDGQAHSDRLAALVNDSFNGWAVSFHTRAPRG